MKIYLDTETTGLNESSEIIQIAIISEDGSVLYNSLIKCSIEIEAEAQSVHGISKEDLINAPRWVDVYKDIAALIEKSDVVCIYNADFDQRLIRQTSQRYDIDFPDFGFKTHCLMREYAHYFNNGKRSSLMRACFNLGVDYSNLSAHSAVDDCELTRRLDLEMRDSIKMMIQWKEEERQSLLRKNKARLLREKSRLKKLSFLPSPEDMKEYPYFATSRPKGSIPLSSIKLRDMDKYEFLGTCCDAYGKLGYLMKLKTQES